MRFEIYYGNRHNYLISVAEYKNMNIEIIELSKRPDLIVKAIDFFWKCWGKENNYKFYRNCILNSTDEQKVLPKFYLVLDKNEIIATYALLTNDIISRQDLMPWLACLFVNKEYRNNGIAGQLLDHGLLESKRKGFDNLYLATDLEGFYEKKDWKHITNGFDLADIEFKIYSRTTKN